MGIDEIYILSADGHIRANIAPADGSIYRAELMSCEYVQLRFNLRTPATISLGDYVRLDGVGYGRFEITSLQRPTYNVKTGAWQYDLRFDASYWRLKNKIFYYDRQAGNECAFSLTHDIAHHLDLLAGNIRACGFDVRVVVDGTIDTTAIKPITYESKSIIDAMTAIAEAFECEWWWSGDVLTFGKCAHGDEITMREGYEVNGMASSDSADDYCTRIIAFGSERNLSSKYRAGAEEPTNHISKKRLMLPAGTPYVDVKSNMTDAEIVERVFVFDDIYPRRVGKIATISTKEYNETNEESNETTAWNAFRFTDDGINFSADFKLPNEVLKIQFQTGVLAGMEFDVEFNPDGEREKNPDGTWNANAQIYEIIRNDNYGINLPTDEFAPAVGDEYVLYNFDATKLNDVLVEYDGEMMGMVDAGEAELLDKAREQAQKIQQDAKTYTCPMNMVRFYGYIEDVAGNLQYNIGAELDFAIGQRVRLYNDAYFRDGRSSRIYAIEKQLNGRACTYTIAENAQYSRLTALEKSIGTIAQKNNNNATGANFGKNNYILRGGDESDARYFFGNLVTREIKARAYDSGKGFDLIAGYDDGTNPRLIMKDNGKSLVAFSPKEERLTFDDNATGEIELVWNNAYVLANKDKAVSVRFNAGYKIQGNGFVSLGVKCYCKRVPSIQPAPRLSAGVADGGAVDGGGGASSQYDWEELPNIIGDEFAMAIDDNGEFITTTYSLKAVISYEYRRPRGEYVTTASLTAYMVGTDENGLKTLYDGSSAYESTSDAKSIDFTENRNGTRYAGDGVYLLRNGSRMMTYGGAYVFAGNLLDFSLGEYTLADGDVRAMREVVTTLLAYNVAGAMNKPLECVFNCYICTDTPDGLTAGCFSARTTNAYIDSDINHLHFILCAFGRNYHIASKSAVTGSENQYIFNINKF